MNITKDIVCIYEIHKELRKLYLKNKRILETFKIDNYLKESCEENQVRMERKTRENESVIRMYFTHA